MRQFPTIQSERLKLRAFKIEDAKSVQTLAGDPEVAKTTLLIPHPYRDGMAEKWISTHLASFYNEQGLTLAITKRDDHELIGAIGLSLENQHKRATLGYWIGRRFWGNGFCTEATQAVIEYAFKEFDLNKVEASYMKENTASGKVMRKCGMKHEGTFEDHIFKDGRFHTIEFYGIIKNG